MGFLDQTQEANPFDKFVAPSVYAGDHMSLPQSVIGGAIATMGISLLPLGILLLLRSILYLQRNS